MLHPRDIRLGNWVRVIASGDVSCVTAIQQDGVALGNALILLFDHIEPIPLSKNNLVELGFHADNQGSALALELNADDKLVANPYVTGGYAVQLCCKGNWSGHKPQSVHTLQNLYFALIGEELQVDKEMLVS